MTILLILGGTGMVGRQLIRLALDNPNVTRVIAPTRPVLPSHFKLQNPIVNYASLPADADWWKVDAVLCAIGTTKKIAGSDENFYKIDHDYVLAAARLARATSTPHFVYNSSLGADTEASSFYLRVKGQVEEDLMKLNFDDLTIVRPSFLYGGSRPKSRPGEAVALFLAKFLSPILPKKYRPVLAANVAEKMIDSALHQTGLTIIESDNLH